jgi:acetate kinase
MRILALNPGSSTLKYRLIDLSGPTVQTRAKGTVDHVVGDSTTRAAHDAIERCRGEGIDAVACRVVHGGERFTQPTRVTREVLSAIGELSRLAPLHNPIAVEVLAAVLEKLPAVPVVAVFDTAFHQTMPEVAALYALPLDLAREKGLRRYGFHGISHRYVALRLAEHLGRLAPPARWITCHLGNGVSLCAIREGQCIDTSMGLTPLEGLVMGTRSGDVDPGLVLHLLRTEGWSPDEVDELLNQRSGLLGLGGHADVRDLTREAQAGNARAVLALDVFAYRIRKYIGAYAAALEGLEAIAFTAGIGENSALVREKVCAGLGWLGLQLDRARNEQPGAGEACISVPGSRPMVWVIPTDEETQMARETVGLLARQGAAEA